MQSTSRPPSDSFIRPSGSGNTRSALTLSASQSASRSPSAWATPSSTRRPGPIAATERPSTDTEARLTRWISARTASRSASRLAQLGGGPFGRNDVEVHAGAELETGEVRESRQDVDPSAEVLRAAGSGPHAQAQRRRAAGLA